MPYRRRTHFRGAGLILLAVMILTACSGERYQEGYQAGLNAAAQSPASYEDGYDAGYREGLADGLEQAGAQKDVDGTADSSGFVLVSQVVPDCILEIRYYSTYNFVGERINGYQEPVALLTREAAEALRQASDTLLAQGYRLKIYDAYRPQSAVDHFKEWAQDPEEDRMKPYFYPDLEKSVLFDQGYISARSGHSRGSTVDLTLYDVETGKEADMGGTFDYFGPRSHVDYADLTREQEENRVLLRQTMEACGFRGISSEWWHFTLEDEPYPDTYFTFPVANLEKGGDQQPASVS